MIDFRGIFSVAMITCVLHCWSIKLLEWMKCLCLSTVSYNRWQFMPSTRRSQLIGGYVCSFLIPPRIHASRLPIYPKCLEFVMYENPVLPNPSLNSPCKTLCLYSSLRQTHLTWFLPLHIPQILSTFYYIYQSDHRTMKLIHLYIMPFACINH